MKQLQQDYEGGNITLKPLVQRLRSWEAHLTHGDTHRMRRKLFDAYAFRRNDQAAAECEQLGGRVEDLQDD
jgi:RNA-directed DNA polymerase